MYRNTSNISNELREYSSWNTGKLAEDRITLFDYSTFIATPDILFAMAELFDPKLYRFEGCYFIEEKFSEDIYLSWKLKGLGKREIEKVMNHIHITSILQDSDMSIALAKHCCELIVDMWNKIFRNNNITSEVLGSNLEDLSITFFSN
jgi:hypothetical protein